MTQSSTGVPAGRVGGDITLPPSSEPSSSREVSLEEHGSTSPTSHVLSQEEQGTARAGCQLGFHGFLPHTPPLPLLLLQPPDGISERLPHKHTMAVLIQHKSCGVNFW